jgi:hypothetical protein
MAPGFLENLLFILEYQWECFFGFGGGVEGQGRIILCLNLLILNGKLHNDYNY